MRAAPRGWLHGVPLAVKDLQSGGGAAVHLGLAGAGGFRAEGR